ncbi:hypothetical protein J6590_058292 [Homalodisca vitripennis]|nr:hypothetical protein J6590_058292 [Homalodisca vitripennis]
MTRRCILTDATLRRAADGARRPSQGHSAAANLGVVLAAIPPEYLWTELTSVEFLGIYAALGSAPRPVETGKQGLVNCVSFCKHVTAREDMLRLSNQFRR